MAAQERICWLMTREAHIVALQRHEAISRNPRAHVVVIRPKPGNRLRKIIDKMLRLGPAKRRTGIRHTKRAGARSWPQFYSGCVYVTHVPRYCACIAYIVGADANHVRGRNAGWTTITARLLIIIVLLMNDFKGREFYASKFTGGKRIVIFYSAAFRGPIDNIYFI